MKSSKKLRYYGVRGVANDLMRSYLANRLQIVELEWVKSSTTKLKHGIPQGSILGLLFILIYIMISLMLYKTLLLYLLMIPAF